MPQVLEEAVEVNRLDPRGRVQWIDEQIVEWPLSQKAEDSSIFRKGSVDVPCPQG